MKVAIVHNIPVSYKHLLFSELARRGFKFEVLFLASGSKDRIEVPDTKAAPYRSRIGFDGSCEDMPFWRIATYVWRSLSEIRPSTVIIAGWSDVGVWTANLWCALHHCPSVLWAESNQFDHPRVFWKELIKRAFLRRFAAANVYGTSNAEYLVKLGFNPGLIWLKRAVGDTSLFTLLEEPRSRSDTRRVILFVGRLAPEKNIEFVFESIRALSPEVKKLILLRLVGYGPLEDSLRLKAETLGLKDIVEFAGSRRHGELPETYHSADVLLLPSTSEPWGLTANEGMLCGLPILLSNRCGCARDFVSPSTGWSFDPYDSTELSRLLEKVAWTPLEDLRSMGRNAAAIAREYSPENCADVVLNCLTSVDPEQGETLPVFRYSCRK